MKIFKLKEKVKRMEISISPKIDLIFNAYMSNPQIELKHDMPPLTGKSSNV